MKTAIATAIAFLALAAPASSAPQQTYPGTPTVTITTVRGGDFVTIDFQAGGFYRADH